MARTSARKTSCSRPAGGPASTRPSSSSALADRDVKDALRSATDEVLALGVFGVPTIVIGEELFWGDDRLEDAAAAHRSLRER